MLKKRKKGCYPGAAAQWLVCCSDDPAKTAAVGSTMGRDRVGDCFSLLLSQDLCRLVSACLAFVCATQTEIAARIEL